MTEMSRADNSELYKLVSGLIICGFRGSAQWVVNEHIENYLHKKNDGSIKCINCMSLCRGYPKKKEEYCKGFIDRNDSKNEIQCFTCKKWFYSIKDFGEHIMNEHGY